MSKRVTVIVDGREYIVEVGELGESPVKATVNRRTFHVEVPRHSPPPGEQGTPAKTPAPETKQAAGDDPAVVSSAITAPMPGNIVEVKVKVGDRVTPGDVVCVLEAMKMNNMIHANRAGAIASVEVILGQAVDYGTVLVTFE